MTMLLVLFAVLTSARPASATPPDDIKAYCASVHQSYQFRLICVRNEEAAQKRLMRLEGLPYGIPRDVWEYCSRVHTSWQYVEICARKELEAKKELSR
jgi:hypothetical protein